MATVDLDALATALRAAGFSVQHETYGLGIYEDRRKEQDGGFIAVIPSGFTVRGNPDQYGCHVAFCGEGMDDVAIKAFDIIRRAVSPSAPEGLRDRIAEAIASYWNKKIDTEDSVFQYTPDECLGEADAVLAVLPPAPRGDVGDVMDLVLRYGYTREHIGAVGEAGGSSAERRMDEYGKQGLQHLAAIRAMLEGTA